MGDMEWLIESGLEGAIIRAARTTRVIGICGGFQLLGKEMHDPDGVEHGGDMRGLDFSIPKQYLKKRRQEREFMDIFLKNTIFITLIIYP